MITKTRPSTSAILGSTNRATLNRSSPEVDCRPANGSLPWRPAALTVPTLGVGIWELTERIIGAGG
eukprot:316089-Prorocentrum_minimum.AAC.1